MTVLIARFLNYSRSGFEGETAGARPTEHQTSDYRFINSGLGLPLDNKVGYRAFVATQGVFDMEISAGTGFQLQRVREIFFDQLAAGVIEIHSIQRDGMLEISIMDIDSSFDIEGIIPAHITGRSW
jgi:hypothetical protein